jgi:shikimate dehydrogenase
VITGATRLAAVVGSPVRHSLSPTILNAAFAAADLDWVYTAFEVAAGRGGDAVAAMRTLGIHGLSVTMPHKAAVCEAVDDRTTVAAELGAVNCVFRHGDELVGDNTDGAGFLDALRLDRGVDVSGRRCVVVGAGGAGRAVARALGGAGAAEVAVVNRSPEPAARAAELAGVHGRVGAAADVAAADLVVNATPIGTGSDETPVPAELLRADLAVLDLVYRPSPTRLVREARAVGARARGGGGMLLRQAALSFSLWTDREAPVDVMRDALRRELRTAARA